MTHKVQVERITFDVFEVDLRTEELWKGLRKIRCQRQPFRVLRALLEQPGAVVSREELQRAIWGAESPADADHSLGIAVNKLREALGDSADAPRFVETLSRRGYRFIAPVAMQPTLEAGTETAADAAAASPEPQQFREQFQEQFRASFREHLAAGEPELERGTEQAAAGHAVKTEAPVAAGPAGTRAASGRNRWSHVRAVSLRLLPVLVPMLALLLAGLLGGYWLARWSGGDRSTPMRIDQLTRNDSIFPGVPSMESFAVLATDGSRLYSSILDNGQTEIASIDAGTGEMQQLELPSEIVNPTLGDISPDGSRLLVRSHVSSDSEQPVWVAPRSGGSALRVGNIRAHDAVWMPDGESVLYASGNDLDVMRLADGTTTHLATLPGRAFWMRWSPDGRLLRFTLLDPLSHTSSLWQIANGGRPEPLLAGWTRPASECCGVWTPDGRSYVFQSGHQTGNRLGTEAGGSDLWRLRGSATSAPERLTNGPLRFTAPVAERGGLRIDCVGLDVRSELERFDPGLRRFVAERGFLSMATRASYSRDRKWVAWTDAAGRLWRAGAADGSEKVQLTPESLQVFLAQWSPDGRHLVAMAREPGESWQLFLVNADGGVPERLLHEKRNEADPTWSADGKQVAFGRTPDLMGREDGPKQIEVLDLATRTVRAVPGSEGLFSPRWSPDGRWIAALTLGEQRLMLFDVAAGTWQPVGGLRAADPVWTADSTALYMHAVFDRPQTIERVGIPAGAGGAVVTPVAMLTSPLASDKADYVFVGITREDAPLVRVRTATGNLYSLALGR